MSSDIADPDLSRTDVVGIHEHSEEDLSQLDPGDPLVVAWATSLIATVVKARERLEALFSQNPHERVYSLGSARMFMVSMEARAEEVIQFIRDVSTREELLSTLAEPEPTGRLYA